MLWIYYALLDGNLLLVITINSLESVKLITLFIVVGFGLIVLLTEFLFKRRYAWKDGWICLIFSLCVFVAPLGVVIPNTLGFAFGVIQIILYFVYKNKKPVIDDKIIEFKEKMSEMDEPRVPGGKDQNKFIRSENVPNPQGVGVARSPIAANHTILMLQLEFDPN
ncbi:hypothetical protein L1987_22881 [Smallanthus sonchifolius]|uniref:Uncharacterized protein n=1 Tax=Smallanthus sonchifolius TaxID=185202 RepID=A0ACB9IGN7_9ASTR|nr:hypothetical protein L1987_22881 [Smallanthus sonchifolius]